MVTMNSAADTTIHIVARSMYSFMIYLTAICYRYGLYEDTNPQCLSLIANFIFAKGKINVSYYKMNLVEQNFFELT